MQGGSELKSTLLLERRSLGTVPVRHLDLAGSEDMHTFVNIPGVGDLRQPPTKRLVPIV